ncbi:hypothetical protein [Cohnella sp. WQ 127256]|uniref:hypothetical protein n=1 Tax=Cohnella sp. WQ 127256 TaxID=2938790 RepID=UPI0021186442|nr:hypothetical protein [Cohnella sp. WQ 127256]
MKSTYVVLIFILILVGCQSPSSTPSKNSQSSTPSSTPSAITPSFSPDATYSDFVTPTDLLTELRNLEDTKTNLDALYRLHEYKVDGSLQAVEKWLRDETKRIGGTVTERYSYAAFQQMDLILNLPSKQGIRIVSTYAPKYGDEQHLVVLESTFDTLVEFGVDTEDHALVVITPDKDGNTHETFLANYFHQHTDIYSAYFYTQAFFAQLKEEGYELDLNYGSDVADYVVGYFDAQGNEVFAEDITDTNRHSVVFGVQLNKDFLPKLAAERELLLRSWAQTLLMGNKADSFDYDLTQTLSFLMKGQVFASYTISDLI